MAIKCSQCGAENKDGSVICSECGNMLIAIFDEPIKSDKADVGEAYEPEAKEIVVKNEVDVSKEKRDNQVADPTSSVISKKEVKAKYEIPKNKWEKPDYDGLLDGYLFRIGSLIEVQEFVNMKTEVSNLDVLKENDKKELLDKIKERANRVFAEDIDDYKKNGTFLSKMGETIVAFIVACIGLGLFAPVGVIFLIVTVYCFVKGIIRLIRFKKAHHSKHIYKTLNKAGLL